MHISCRSVGVCCMRFTLEKSRVLFYSTRHIASAIYVYCKPGVCLANLFEQEVPYNGKIWRVLYLANGPFERIGVFNLAFRAWLRMTGMGHSPCRLILAIFDLPKFAKSPNKTLAKFSRYTLYGISRGGTKLLTFANQVGN